MSERDFQKRELDYEVFSEDEGLRLDQFLNDRMVWRSRNSIRKLIDEKQIRRKDPGIRDGEVPRLKSSRRVKAGEVYGITIPRAKREIESLSDKEGLDLPILYEDEWILAINKPAGVPVHPSGRILEGTVITLLNARYRENDPENTPPLKLCHRLDLETSGVLLVGKDPIAHPRFAALFEQRRVTKEYLALVHGELAEDEGMIDLPIGMAEKSAVYLKRGINHKRGQPARTGFKVERRFAGFTLVRLRLYTGRHHQIRVHMLAVNHPIVGDKIYGLDENLFLRYHDGALDEADWDRLILPRQALHAARLTLEHVILKKELTFEAPLTPEVQAFMDTLSPK